MLCCAFCCLLVWVSFVWVVGCCGMFVGGFGFGCFFGCIVCYVFVSVRRLFCGLLVVCWFIVLRFGCLNVLRYLDCLVACFDLVIIYCCLVFDDVVYLVLIWLVYCLIDVYGVLLFVVLVCLLFGFSFWLSWLCLGCVLFGCWFNFDLLRWMTFICIWFCCGVVYIEVLWFVTCCVGLLFLIIVLFAVWFGVCFIALGFWLRLTLVWVVYELLWLLC